MIGAIGKTDGSVVIRVILTQFGGGNTRCETTHVPPTTERELTGNPRPNGNLRPSRNPRRRRLVAEMSDDDTAGRLAIRVGGSDAYYPWVQRGRASCGGAH